MSFDQFICFLTKRLKEPLPGNTIHNLMIPSVRLAEFAAIPEKAKKSSVLLLLYKKRESIFTILILRPEYDGVHSKQVSFPGGGFQASDITLENTALRETMEEIGIASSRIQLMGSLSELYIPPSNFVVKPFVGFTRDMGRLTPDKHEVEEIIEADINQFMGNRNIKTKKIRIGNGQEIQTPYYDVSDFVIWGATAMILREFSEICSEIEI